MVSSISTLAYLGRSTIRSMGTRRGLPAPGPRAEVPKNPIFQPVSIYEMSYLKRESRGIWKTENLSQRMGINFLA